MSKKLYVGNLSYAIDDVGLEEIFAKIGNVESAKVITDRDTGRSKGFGFVEMSNDQEANQAIEELNGVELEGRNLSVNEARPRPSNNDRRGGGGGYRGNRY